MNRFTILSIITVIGFIGCISLIPNTDALSQNRDYVILSEKYFFVFGLDDQSNVIVRDGGIMYNSEWQMINKTDIEVEQYYENGEAGWIIGNLQSGEQFWFTWNLTINSDVVTETFVYDGETLTHFPDYKAYMTRLFFLG